MRRNKNSCRSHPTRTTIYDLNLGQAVCAGCLNNDDVEADSVNGRERASRETSTPVLIEAIEAEYQARGETLSRGMYLWLLTQDTSDIAHELDRLRTES